jgi:hypothetical protein
MARGYRPPSSRLAIDANVLSLLVAYHHCVCTSIPVGLREGILDDVHGAGKLPPERFDDLWQVFTHATHRMVTQHVIAETLNCRRGWLRDHREDARRSGVLLVERFDVEEQPCCISDLAADTFYLRALIALGPTDAGLLYVAALTRATLISDDGTLRQFAAGRGVAAYPVCDVHLLARHP